MHRYVLQRRLRIWTLRLEVGRTPAEVYAGADADAILLVLMHKIAAAAAMHGPAKGRALLQDWLVLFTAAYNKQLGHALASADQASAQGRGHCRLTALNALHLGHHTCQMALLLHHVPSSTSSLSLMKACLDHWCCGLQVDAEFADSEALQPVPRLVFALLRSPLLTKRPGDHLDLRAAIFHLWSTLPPAELHSAIYPLLSSFATPDTQVSAERAPLTPGIFLKSLVPCHPPAAAR
jgi:protein transport protein SEC24